MNKIYLKNIKEPLEAEIISYASQEFGTSSAKVIIAENNGGTITIPYQNVHYIYTTEKPYQLSENKEA